MESGQTFDFDIACNRFLWRGNLVDSLPRPEHNAMSCVCSFVCLFVSLGGQAVLVAHSPEVCLGAAGPHGIPVRLRSVPGAHLNQCISRSSRNLAR